MSNQLLEANDELKRALTVLMMLCNGGLDSYLKDIPGLIKKLRAGDLEIENSLWPFLGKVAVLGLLKQTFDQVYRLEIHFKDNPRQGKCILISKHWNKDLSCQKILSLIWSQNHSKAMVPRIIEFNLRSIGT